jgi:hypothetical protein
VVWLSVAFVQVRVHVSFRVARATTFGQEVRVSGAPTVLGAWDVENALRLTWQEGDVWSGLAEMECEGSGRAAVRVWTDSRRVIAVMWLCSWRGAVQVCHHASRGGATVGGAARLVRLRVCVCARRHVRCVVTWHARPVTTVASPSRRPRRYAARTRRTCSRGCGDGALCVAQVDEGEVVLSDVWREQHDDGVHHVVTPTPRKRSAVSPSGASPFSDEGRLAEAASGAGGAGGSAAAEAASVEGADAAHVHVDVTDGAARDAPVAAVDAAAAPVHGDVPTPAGPVTVEVAANPATVSTTAASTAGATDSSSPAADATAASSSAVDTTAVTSDASKAAHVAASAAAASGVPAPVVNAATAAAPKVAAAAATAPPPPKAGCCIVQ